MKKVTQSIHMWILLAAADISLKLGIKIQDPYIAPVCSVDIPAFIETVVSNTARASRYPLWFNMSCLRKAVVIRRELGRKGIETEILYGVRKNGQDITAHAWLRSAKHDLSIDPSGVSQEFIELRSRP